MKREEVLDDREAPFDAIWPLAVAHYGRVGGKFETAVAWAAAQWLSVADSACEVVVVQPKDVTPPLTLARMIETELVIATPGRDGFRVRRVRRTT